MRQHAFIWLALVIGCAGAARDLRIRPADLPAEQRQDAAMIAAAYDAEPEDAAVLYQVAAVLAQTGRADDALEALRRMAAFETGVDPRPRDGFESLVDHPEFRRIVAGIRAKNPPVLGAREAFTIDEADLAPEGIAWSAKRDGSISAVASARSSPSTSPATRSLWCRLRRVGSVWCSACASTMSGENCGPRRLG